MLEKIKDSFLWEIEKRFKNPFLGAFIISWVFWNWKIIYIVLFIDEKYVSLLPIIENTNKFITKYEYIVNLNIINYYDSLLFPFITSIAIVIFIEWWTTIMIIIINNVKNYILWHEKLTKEESQKLKNELKNERKKSLELLSSNNDEILSLQNKISEYDGKIEQKVSEKLRITENKNIKRIKELEDDLNKSEIISSERLEKNKNLEKLNIELKNSINIYKVNEKSINSKLEESFSHNNDLIFENQELNERLSSINKPLDEQYIIEYNEFKKSHFFSNFKKLIELIENDPYDLYSKLNWIDIKFLKVKWIINEISEDNWYTERLKYVFTKKWDKFVEYFLDNYEEDIPF